MMVKFTPHIPFRMNNLGRVIITSYSTYSKCFIIKHLFIRPLFALPIRPLFAPRSKGEGSIRLLFATKERRTHVLRFRALFCSLFVRRKTKANTMYKNSSRCIKIHCPVLVHLQCAAFQGTTNFFSASVQPALSPMVSFHSRSAPQASLCSRVEKLQRHLDPMGVA